MRKSQKYAFFVDVFVCHLLLLKIIRTTGESFCVIFAFVAILGCLHMRLGHENISAFKENHENARLADFCRR